MLQAAIVFFVLAIIALVLGLSGVAGLSMGIAKLLLGVFLVLAILSFVGNMMTKSKQSH
jgi:uncharacterized membrane protein YtjA (UPF0391 family)